ncbi:MarR family transcriptional regulator [Streptomyces sp. NPDC047043]|uniref:MarR family winged helix-turn-helix transcriptional regulator n=1 Tax=Streptomyces sp. NPDC047043 TaxID=3154497 RepID=UPI0033E94F9B
MTEDVTERESEQLPGDLVRLVRTLHRALRQRQTSPAGQRVRPLAQEVLQLVGSRPGVSVREVADTLAMQPNNVSTIVTQLIRDGFIDRRPSTRDRRFAELHPTEKTIAAGSDIDDSLDKAIADALLRLSPQAGQRISAALPDLWELARTIAPTT